ncbi:MAG: hypothetical protein LBJ10_12200, partial [Clostridiales bacterium]|nr:hypothetical protein [Clostridiales bacterium]
MANTGGAGAEAGSAQRDDSGAGAEMGGAHTGSSGAGAEAGGTQRDDSGTGAFGGGAQLDGCGLQGGRSAPPCDADAALGGADTLYGGIRAYSEKGAIPFHMPGHKLGKGFVPQGVFSDPAAFDLTELPRTDDLHMPRGMILSAQRRAADAFGAGKTWFLVNGSSCGVHAMVMAACAPGHKLLIARNFHYSAWNAMCMARVRPIFVYAKPPPGHSGAAADAAMGSAGGGGGAAENAGAACGAEAFGSAFAEAFGAAGGVFEAGYAEAAIAAIRSHPDADAIFLTRPDYYGNACDIAPIVDAAHSYGLPVLVDEAHGAHLCFSGRLPVSAMEAGADICVQSAHKTLPAFTQGAYAHMSRRALGGGGLEGRFETALRALQTSSPSFLILSSLDYAREYMQKRGRRELDRVLDQCEAFFAEMSALGYGVPGGCGDSREGGADGGAAPIKRYSRDMTRLVLNTARIGLSGSAVENMLAERHNIAIEMSDPWHIVMISTVADRDEDFSKLKAALGQIARGAGADGAGYAGAGGLG